MQFIYIILYASIIMSSTTLHIVESQSTIKWKGSKSTGSYHDGLVLIDNGFINIHNNIIVGGEININMNSIICTDIKDSTSNQYLIAHLKNDDFFSVASFPTASLIINSIKPINNISLDQSNFLKGEYLFTCDLTIKDSTHTIDFIADLKINQDAAIATGKIEIDRSQFGIKYKSKTWYPDLGDKFINDIFELYFHLVALPQS